ncbi:MAG: hypothetical protein HOW73_12450 [Polyangiaceae bacterium]|nr:hypothetical protein [Polyangiaceae bacterium]
MRRLVIAVLSVSTTAAVAIAGCRGPTFQTGGGTSCEPEAAAFAGADCGAFVEADAEGNGTQQAPYSTIGEAIENGATRIYVCGDSHIEAVSVPAGIAIYGGLACGTWEFALDRRTELTAPSDRIPLLLLGGNGTIVEGFRVVAPHAEEAGGSSIAFVADEVTATLRRVDIVALDAKAGVDGQPGNIGASGKDGASATGSAPPQGGSSTCDARGGAGGTGAVSSSGAEGDPNQDNGGSAGCTSGGDGDSAPSPGQDGFDQEGLGSIDLSGYHPPQLGAVGDTGKPGGGGGGGGSVQNAAGGAGGSGGCGGAGGLPGSSGGSSIAILSLNASLTFEECSASVGRAGDGGQGGVGGPGGEGGEGGTGFANACDGGDGAVGGTGGRGGDGAGGHALIVAFLGDMPDLDGLVFSTPDQLQAGTSAGQSGRAEASLDFTP